MKIPRRRFLQLVAGAAVLPTASRVSWAQAYPTRSVRMIECFGAGGAPDIVGRLLGQWLSEHLGQPFIIENRTGAAGNIGTEAVARSAPDGYTLLLAVTANTINTTLYDKLAFDFARDFAPVASVVMRVPFIMEVHPSFPARTVPEFIAYAKANPGKINMASAGIGHATHIYGEMFKMMTGVNMVHVPYRGAAAALNDLLAGQVHVIFDPMPSSIEHIRSGRLHPLAVTTSTRWEGLPDLPTLGEFVPGYEASGWLGVVVPRNTPSEIVEKLNREINAVLADAKLKARLEDLGGAVVAGSPADFGKHIAQEIKKWAKVIKYAGLRAV